MAQEYDRKFLEKLAQKVLAGKASKAEEQLLESYYQAFEKLPEHSAGLSTDERAALKAEMKARLMAHIIQPEAIVIPIYRRSFFKIAAAACLLFMLGFTGYLLLHKPQIQQTAQNQPHDILPGSNKAILITHGKQISVTDAKNGLLAQQGGTAITKIADGELAYNSAGNNTNGAMVYDTLITPRGGQHELTLSDGSKLSLNADTKLRFPEHFAAGERRIELISGQARFHIVHNAAVPFFVMVKGQTVKDIGTDFDINAYDDEPSVKTTLIEGSVEVAKGRQSKVLKPGQQTIIHSDEPIIVQTANIDQVTAWNRGQFYFEKTSLRELMRQVSRWYDIDVVYQGNVSNDGFTGQPSRKSNLSQMLKILQYGDVHFKIEPGKGKSAGTLVITQ